MTSAFSRQRRSAKNPIIGINLRCSAAFTCSAHFSRTDICRLVGFRSSNLQYMHLNNAVIKLPRTLMLCITVLVINACDGNTFEIDESLSSEGGGTEATINSEQTINPTVPPEPEPVATFQASPIRLSQTNHVNMTMPAHSPSLRATKPTFRGYATEIFC